MEQGYQTGILTAIRPATKGGRLWLCSCECGREAPVSRWHLEKGRRYSCGLCGRRPILQTVKCVRCNEIKNYDQFRKRTGKATRTTNRCLPCETAFWAEQNLALKLQAMLEYGNGVAACTWCREAHLEFLTIDHINNDGNEQRRIGANQLYKWLKKNGYPAGHRVLCFNCNLGRNTIERTIENRVHTTPATPQLPISSGLRRCTACVATKPIDEFDKGVGKKNGHLYLSTCRVCTPDVVRRRGRLLYKQYKEAVFKHYSGGNVACCCCGEAESYKPGLDHADGSGAQHRRDLKTPTIYNWLYRNNFPALPLRVLCHNCNHAISAYGHCSHNHAI